MKCLSYQFQKGNSFHFYNRCVDSEKLFHDDEDYLLFLEKFKTGITKYPLYVYSYCLMPNHFHFFLEQKSDVKIYGIFNSILSSYVQKFNRKYKRRGALLAGKLQSVLVDDESYNLNLSKYIHLNPVKAGLVELPEEWKYSNYTEWVSLSDDKLFDKNIMDKLKITSDEYIKIIKEELDLEGKFVKYLFDN